jgi:cellulose synthase/poly-beta-1,6-N-acetylglucosamine synthase-like glycosyltransferase
MNQEPPNHRLEDASSPALTAARRLLLTLYMTSAAVYFAWRLTVFNPRYPAFSFVFYVAEIVGFLWGLNLLLGGLRLARREPPAPPPGLPVDVFIPTYNEPAEIVRRTLVAALRIEYPHETWLLDDGSRPQMRELARELGCRYLARTGNANAKAGNLNHAMLTAKGEFIAVFDADHVADPRFLQRTLGFFEDPKVAFVQTPQEFHNFDSYQHLGGDRARGSWNEHSLFYRLIQRSRDRGNAAMMCGCSVVLRRAALDAVGGFAVGTVTEDMHTSVRMHAAGWRSVFHSETLSAGYGPLDALSYRRQRLRWAQGSLQVFLRERLLTCPGLSPAQRSAYLLHVLSILEGWRTAFICLAPAGVLLFGVWPMETRFGPWAAFSLPYFALSVLSFEEIGRGQGRFFKNEVFNVARCTSQMRALLGAGRRRLAFSVTPKVRLKDHEKIGFVFPWLVLAWTAAALAIATWRLAEGRLTIGRDCLAIAMLWAVFSSSSCARLCGLTRRCARNRRAFTRFPVSLEARLWAESSPGEIRAAVIEDVSPGGLSLRAPDSGRLPSGPCVVVFFVLGREFALRVDLKPVSPDGLSGGPFLELESPARDAFEHAIHVHRIRYLALFDRNDERTLLGPLAELIRRASPEAALTASKEGGS